MPTNLEGITLIENLWYKVTRGNDTFRKGDLIRYYQSAIYCKGVDGFIAPENIEAALDSIKLILDKSELIKTIDTLNQAIENIEYQRTKYKALLDTL